MELAGQRGHREGAIITGIGSLVIGSLITAFTGQRGPQQIGARSALSIFEEKVPFANVVISVGKGGIPEDVEVVLVSQIARDVHSSEADVRAALRRDGYSIITPERFETVLDAVECRLLEGSISLPVQLEEL